MHIPDRKITRGFLLTILFCIVFSAKAFAVDAGAKAPAFELPGQAGTVSLADSAGSVVYVDFWASWCGPCRQSFPWMNQLQEKYRAKGLKVIAVNVDARSEDARKFLLQNQAGFTVAFDPKGTTPASYGVKGMPTSFLVGRDGKVIFRHQGFNEAEKDNLEKEINAALEAGK
ncbi:MAG: TlpA family protein disulfide reductase [Chlorobiaceae bacterium]|nr:TlpA family protein disulfide reductase [Chlorobiaceae bacterium]